MSVSAEAPFTAPSPPAAARARDRTLRWVANVALAFVLLSLAALVAVPLAVQRQNDRLRTEVEDVAEPARTLVTRVQYAVAREMSALRGYLITGSPRSAQSYAEARALEQTAYAELEPLAQRLGPEVLEAFVELRTLSEQWHQRVAEAGTLTSSADTADAPPRLPAGQQVYEQVLRSASELDATIVRAAQQRRAAIRAQQHVGLQITIGLVLLALLSALAVEWLGRRVRLLAGEAERRRHEAERALAEMHRSLEARERLMRGITHDLKNPLGAADGYAELLQMGLRGELEPGQAELVAGIRRSVHSALAIITDLLDLSRAERGGLALTRVEVDLAETLHEAAADHRGAAEAAGHTLTLQPPAQPVLAHTDPQRVRQVLGNLLSNAIKYTPAPGHVLLSGALDEDDAAPRPGRWARLDVTDTGPGIPPEEQENIFLEFHRLHAGQVNGHGLGLAISRRIARLLGGEVTVRSEVGRGSTFSLWLPLRADGAAERRRDG